VGNNNAELLNGCQARNRKAQAALQAVGGPRFSGLPCAIPGFGHAGRAWVHNPNSRVLSKPPLGKLMGQWIAVLVTWSFAALVPSAQAVSVTAEELSTAKQWAMAKLEGVQRGESTRDSTEPPFSFVYEGKPAAQLLKTWAVERNGRKLEAARAEHTVVWRDPTSGLEVRWVAIAYADLPTVEWTLYFQNTGTNDTGIIERIQALDLGLSRPDRGEFLLHHHVGSPANGDDYGPLETPLKPGSSKRLGAAGGRPTNADWSYFNLEWGGEGVIVAIGWPGQWAAEFVRDNARGLTLRAGQELTHFKLLRGEQVRAPLITLQFWRKHDAPDRQGITEIRHVTGHLAYWDELRRRHAAMLIDSCASGDRRNDLESMRRAVPLWRSDYAFETTGHQCMTYGLSLWLPFHGTGTVAARNAPYYGSGKTPVDPYAFWSNASQLSLGLGIDLRVKDLDYATLRRLIAQWRQVSPNYYGDFYPLTPWRRDDTVWMAWQFDRPELGEGLVQAFRRPRSPYESARLSLRGLVPKARYAVTSIDDADARQELTGAELAEPGLLVIASQQPEARVMTYRKLNWAALATASPAWRELIPARHPRTVCRSRHGHAAEEPHGPIRRSWIRDGHAPGELQRIRAERFPSRQVA
jgi:alpha-galactosidase